MPKNKGKGGKSRRRCRKKQLQKRELIFKQEGQEYATVIKMLGNGRLEAYCLDGKTRICHIRGRMQRRVWINRNDVILIKPKHFVDDKANVIHKYLPEEVPKLKEKEKETKSMNILVFGYIRDAQKLLPFEQNSFFTIPDLIAYECASIYTELFFWTQETVDDNTDEIQFSFDAL